MSHDDNIEAMSYGISYLKLNDDMDEYLKKYCEKHKLTKEQALQHELVKGVLKVYENKVKEEATVE